MTWGSVGTLLDAVQPKCCSCDLPATREARSEKEPRLQHPFCDEHDISQWSKAMQNELWEAMSFKTIPSESLLYHDLPHAMPVRQLLGQVEDDKRYVLRMKTPDEQPMGAFLVMVHETFVIVRVPTDSSEADIRKAMHMAAETTGIAEILVIHESRST